MAAAVAADKRRAALGPLLICMRAVGLADGALSTPDGALNRTRLPAATGEWTKATVDIYTKDAGFASAVATFLRQERAGTIVDIGCGGGFVARTLAREAGAAVLGVDGNAFIGREPPVAYEGGGTAEFRMVPLHKPLPPFFGVFDWVTSFAVAEHVPFNFEPTFVANLLRVARHGLILVWDERSASGTGHVNCRDDAEVVRIFSALGLERDAAASSAIRAAASTRWYRLVHVWRRRPGAVAPEGMPGLVLDSDPASCYASTCFATDDAAEDCRGRWLSTSRALARMLLREHMAACWVPPFNAHYESCCGTGAMGQSLVPGTKEPQHCFSEGFRAVVCCASELQYYHEWTKSAAGGR